MYQLSLRWAVCFWRRNNMSISLLLRFLVFLDSDCLHIWHFYFLECVQCIFINSLKPENIASHLLFLHVVKKIWYKDGCLICVRKGLQEDLRGLNIPFFTMWLVLPSCLQFHKHTNMSSSMTEFSHMAYNYFCQTFQVPSINHFLVFFGLISLLELLKGDLVSTTLYDLLGLPVKSGHKSLWLCNIAFCMSTKSVSWVGCKCNFQVKASRITRPHL